jgi:hypothetical protein
MQYLAFNDNNAVIGYSDTLAAFRKLTARISPFGIFAARPSLGRRAFYRILQFSDGNDSTRAVGIR